MSLFYRLLAALLLTTSPLLAQQASLVAPPPTDSLRLALDRIFAPLDKNQMPTYLAEYGNRYTSLTPYNGILTDSSVTTLTAWRLLYASIVSGNVGKASPLPTFTDLNTALNAQMAATPTAIPVVIQRLQYGTLRPDALTAGLLQVQNGQLYDVPTRTASPYTTQWLFAAAPATRVSATGQV